MKKMKRNYNGWALTNPEQLLNKIDVKHRNEICDHITLSYPASQPAEATENVVAIGIVTTDTVQAVVVNVNGTNVRPDGKKFHVTISVADGHRPVESNAAIEAAYSSESCLNVEYFNIPIEIDVEAF